MIRPTEEFREREILLVADRARRLARSPAKLRELKLQRERVVVERVVVRALDHGCHLGGQPASHRRTHQYVVL